MKHAGIIPLIGGEILASDAAYGVKPEYLLSYSGFGNNEKHLINHYKQQGYDIPYHVLDAEGAPTTFESVDVMSSVCPCAGLSSYHNSAGEHNQNNQWMEKTTKLVLEEIRPKVLWGENAPALATGTGKFMKDKLLKIGDSAGYNMSIYLTKSLLHGNPQIRKRTFYFFWRRDVFDNQIPVFNYYKRENQTIRDLLLNVKSNFQNEPINKSIPSKDDPYYKYLLTEIHGGMSHQDFAASVMQNEKIEGSLNVEAHMILDLGVTYEEIGKWLRAQGKEREADRCDRRDAKLKSGKGVMWRGTIVPGRKTGAFVVHMPYVLTHPTEDRYVTYREAMTIMGLPQDYELLDPENSVNHICQNVPFYTAKDMATEVKAALEGQRTLQKSSFMLQSNFNQTIRESVSNFNITDFAE